VTGFVSLIPSIGGLLASLIVAIPCLLLGSTVFVDMPNEVFAPLVMVIKAVITQFTHNFFALPIVGKFVKLPTVDAASADCSVSPSITKCEGSGPHQALSCRKRVMEFEGKGITYLHPTDPNDGHIEPLLEVP